MVSKARAEALSEAKSAVRAYSRNPNEINADKVESAWQAIRTLDAVLAWRSERAAFLGGMADGGLQGSR